MERFRARAYIVYSLASKEAAQNKTNYKKKHNSATIKRRIETHEKEAKVLEREASVIELYIVVVRATRQRSGRL